MEISKVDENIVDVSASIVFDLAIKQLDLSKNRISYLPDQLGDLLNLKVLNLSRNQLDEKSFPQSMQRLQMLEEVNLSSNNLTEIPSFILDLPRIKVLHIAENKITSLPEKIGQMTSLERLYVGKNGLVNIPRQISQISNLKVLSLANNSLQSVPAEMANLTSLICLQLHQNKINFLPPGIAELQSLEELSLRGNPLISRFVRDLTYSPSSLVELAGRQVVASGLDHSRLPLQLKQRLSTAKCCPNPTCSGVYFDNHYKQIKFADFCGRYRLPLLQFLCSPSCMIDSDDDTTATSSDDDYSPIRMRRVLLG